MDGDRRRRGIHLLLQRAAFPVRGYHPLARSLALAYRLGHALLGRERPRAPLLGRLVEHARTTAEYNVYYGEGRDIYDVRGRVAHESIFNVVDGAYRCPSTQQGYSPFTHLDAGAGAGSLLGYRGRAGVRRHAFSTKSSSRSADRTMSSGFMLRAARATADFYIENTPTDGVPYWDTGASGPRRAGGLPVASCRPVQRGSSRWTARRRQSPRRGSCGSAASSRGRTMPAATRYFTAGLTVPLDAARGAVPEHRPRTITVCCSTRSTIGPAGWDHVPGGAAVPSGRVEHVGRLSHPGSGPGGCTDRPRRAGSGLLPVLNGPAKA